MREKKISGPVCCGQNSNNLRFSKSVNYVLLGVFCAEFLFSGVAYSAICFLPDCQDKPIHFEPSGVEQCLAAGYVSSTSRIVH